jgi:hypothetical protein
MSPEEWAAKELIDSRSDKIEENINRWSKYDKLRMSEDLNELFIYLENARLNKAGRDLVRRVKLSYEKIFCNEIS